ncbi:hypothetical protein [Bacillus sp. FJAT-47783]|uniref:hypothetical protein n=1 Tax=Bacillus sp. FJAT-47783 TaxID=2922712 RepID=UPI001FAC9536|nr:hypothetical protein [Bacillus sp. FJAT-47783]
MRRKWRTMLAVMASIVLVLSACISEEKEEVKSPAPEADKVAEKALEAIVDYDIATLYSMMTEGAIEYAKTPMVGIQAFIDNSEEEILSEGPSSHKGDFEKYTDDGDYIFGAYYGFLEEQGRILYLADMYNPGINDFYSIYTKKNGDRVQYRFELVKEGGGWKIDGLRGWKKQTVKDKTDKYVDYIFSEAEDTVVFHRGGDY